MLRSWLVGVFVLGMAAFLLCRTFIWPAGATGDTPVGEEVAAAKGPEEAGVEREIELEGISIGTLGTESSSELLDESGDVLSALAAIGEAGPYPDPRGSSVLIEPDTPEEARRKVHEFVTRAKAARAAGSSQEVARNLTEALFTGGLGVIREIDGGWFVELPSGKQLELDSPEPDSLEGGKTAPYVDGLDEDLVFYERLLVENQAWILDPANDDGCLWVTENDDGSLVAICERLEREGHALVAPGLVQHVNGLRNSTIQKGHRLKVPTAPLRIVVEVHRHRLSVMIDEVMIRRYSIGIGKVETPTPQGRFTIATRAVDPIWKGVPYGHPDNPLGTRWLGFAALSDFPGASEFGIHGTWEPSSIGGNESKGCIRMLNEDVEELFGWVPRGTGVEIRR